MSMTCYDNNKQHIERIGRKHEKNTDNWAFRNHIVIL